MSLQGEVDELRSIGLDPSEVDLRRYFGEHRELLEVLNGFDLIYVRGGNAFLLRRALWQSGADDVIRELLSDDRLVYAGYSAGPAVLGPTLHGVELFGDDSHVVPPGYRSEVIWEGLNVLPFAFVPHYNSDHPETAGADAAIHYYIHQHIPFVALHDGEALVINDTSRTVVG